MATILTFPKRPERQDTDAALDAGPARVGQPLTRKGQSSAPWAPLVESMARHRRDELEVGWLKENAELLGILNSTGHSRCDGGEAALAHLRPFVETAPRRLQFFPQYYRFILSICLDYEDLTGGATDTGSQLAHWIATRGLVCGELSDLQRAEAQHLLARRAVLLPDPGGQQAGLRSRLHRFASDTAGFAVPDRRRAYELTHVVFYLTDYGRRCAALPDTATQSLIHVGLWAYLDCDWDLVAEVCIALRYLGHPPPPLWEAALQRSLGAYRLLATPVVGADDYHAFFRGPLVARCGGTGTGRAGRVCRPDGVARRRAERARLSSDGLAGAAVPVALAGGICPRGRRHRAYHHHDGTDRRRPSGRNNTQQRSLRPLLASFLQAGRGHGQGACHNGPGAKSPA